MPTTCCVVNCGSRGNRDIVKFFKIPSELHFAHRVDLNELSKKRRRQWIQAIRRKDLSEVKLKYSRVCSKHFLSGKPSELSEENSPDWVPSLAMGYGKDVVVGKKAQMATEKEERASKRRKCLLDDIYEIVPDVLPNEEGGITLLEDGTIENHNDKPCQTDKAQMATEKEERASKRRKCLLDDMSELKEHSEKKNKFIGKLSSPGVLRYNCGSIGCPNKYYTSIHSSKYKNKRFFRFPEKDPKRREQWFIIMNLKKSDIRQYLCEDHFQLTEFCDTEKLRLKKFALPSNIIQKSEESDEFSNNDVSMEHSLSEILLETSITEDCDADSQTSEYDDKEAIQSQINGMMIPESTSPSFIINSPPTLKEIHAYFGSALIEGWCYFATDAELLFIHINILTRKEDMRFSVSENLSVKVSFSQRPEFSVGVTILSVNDIKSYMESLKATVLCKGTGILYKEFASSCTGFISSYECKRWRQDPRCLYCRCLRKRLQSTECA